MNSAEKHLAVQGKRYSPSCYIFVGRQARWCADMIAAAHNWRIVELKSVNRVLREGGEITLGGGYAVVSEKPEHSILVDGDMFGESYE